jgi:sugar phosphate isomerase/epimerase
VRIGLIGIIEEQLKQDFGGALARVAGIGYQGMEFGLATLEQAPLPLDEIACRLADLGLRTVNLHIVAQVLEDRFGEVTATAHRLGCSWVTIPWGPADSAEQLKRDAAAYDRLGARYRAEGLGLCYHNHDHELRRFDGRHGLEILLAESDPVNLRSQLDVCWVRFGGADPVAFLQRYAGRVPLVHLKDVARLEPSCETGHGSHEQMVFTEVGTGIVDFPAVTAAARQAGAEWGTVEQDRMRHLTPWESITCSYLNLKARGLV